MDTQINIKGKYALASKIIRGEDFRNNLNYYDLLCLFDSYLKNCDLKDVTRIKYLFTACWFFDFLDAEGKVLSQCDIHLCIRFCVLIDNMKSWSAFYKARSKQQFKRLLKWLHDNEMIPFSENTVLPKIIWHREESLPSFYTAQEVSAMLDAVDISTAKGKEHYLILTLIVYYSLRISDVVYLKLSSIHWKDNEIRLTAFKNGANITLPLIEPVKLSLLDYLMNVRPSDCTLDYVFVTSDPPYRVKEELRTHSYIIKGYLEQAGVDCSNRHHGFHALRHSGATRLLECDTDVETITAILGHSSPNITMAYLTADIAALKNLALEVPYVKKFNSIFADDLENFVSFKKSLGLKYEKEQPRLIRLDKLLDSLELKEKKITKDTFEYITKRSGMKEANYARQFAVTRDFCKYLITIGYKDIYWEDRNSTFKTITPLVIYSDEEIRMIFSAIDDHIVKSLGTNGYRLWYGMAIIIRLLWSCGLRISEVLSLKKQDINLDQSYLRIWKSKGNRSRIVVMSESMTVCLREYLEMFCSDDSALFLNTKGREIDADSVRDYYHKIQKECYLSLSRLHDLRHCFASKAIRQMIDKGYSEYASSVYLYKYMGHSNFSETEYYLHFTDIDMERIRKIADQFSQEIYKGVINNEEK